ncbi:MAG: hypothetical protein NT045_08855 [Candidatus Aureabacteria bacterium]|nr:hypothetical protein [Candidatus Auribacterota bacterium]
MQNVDHSRGCRAVSRLAMRAAALILPCWMLFGPVCLSARSRDAMGILSPPDPHPVPVMVGFHLLNLTFVNERTETFDADVYIDFTWRDPRLAFVPARPDDKKIYTEKAAEDKLGEIWWPEIEFVNAALPQITNRSLIIKPDGTVEYNLGASTTFRSKLNLRRFPFDEQSLAVRLQSFLWDDQMVRFVPDPKHLGYSPGETFDDLNVRGVTAAVAGVRLRDWDQTYSEFTATILTTRNYRFYIWRVFFPAILIMLISCTVYFMEIDDLYSRVNISLTCLLACIATQFAISFNLPRISYLTPIDKLYMITYGCIAISVAISTLEIFFYKRNHPHCKKCNRFARWFVPLLYLVLLAGIVLM